MAGLSLVKGQGATLQLRNGGNQLDVTFFVSEIGRLGGLMNRFQIRVRKQKDVKDGEVA